MRNLTEFLQNLADDLATWLVYIAIVALFLLSVVRCVAPVWESKRILRRATRLVRKGEKKDSADWQAETFLGRGALYPHWQEYLNNLFFADGAYHNPSNIEDYLNEDTVIYGPGRSAFSDAAPGLMVSLGFLGTLIGISRGLMGFSMDNITEVTQAIQRLIPNMQYAFNTSIVGVVGSILFTIINKNAQGGARHALLAFVSTMNKYAGIASVDPMTQIAIYQQEQTTILHTLSRELKSEFSDSVARAVYSSLLPLEKNIDNFMSVATKEQIRGVNAIVEKFLDAMDDALSGQFASLATAMTTAARSQKDLQQSLSSSIDGIRAMTAEFQEAHRASGELLSQYGKYLDSAAETAHSTNAAAEHMAIVSRQQMQYLQAASGLQAQLSEAAQALSRAYDGLLDAVGAMDAAGEKMADNSEKLLTGVMGDLDKSYNEFFARVDDATRRLSDAVTNVQKGIDSLPKVLDDAASLYAAQAEYLAEALRDTAQRLEG